MLFHTFACPLVRMRQFENRWIDFSVSSNTWRPTHTSTHISCLPHLTLTRTKNSGGKHCRENETLPSPSPINCYFKIKCECMIWSWYVIHIFSELILILLAKYTFCVATTCPHTHIHTMLYPTWTGSDVSIKEFLTPAICIWLLRSKINKYKIGVM